MNRNKYKIIILKFAMWDDQCQNRDNLCFGGNTFDVKVRNKCVLE